MKNIHTPLILICIIVSLSSCKDDDENNPITYPDYGQLKVGNYWVYQQFIVDPAGNETTTNNFDSCYIEKDTLINGEVYFKMYRESLNSYSDYSYLKDSLHYIVDHTGRIVFSSQDFSTVFNARYITASVDTVALVYNKMADKDLVVSTPYGIFTTNNFQETYNMYPNWSSNGDPRYINKRYAENIGIVIETLPFFSSQPNYTERRLVRYHLN